MTRAAVRKAWETEDGARAGLFWALKAASADGERLHFTVGRLRDVLKATGALAHSADTRHQLRFLRHLGFAWLDAPDRTARDAIRKTIADYLPHLGIEARS